MSNIYYLHQSPNTVARWLDDADCVNVEVYALHTLCNALQLYCGETLSHLRQFSNRYWSIHQDWAMQSIEHSLWLFDLYVALHARNKRKEEYLLDRFLLHYIHLLPKREWKNPPLTMPTNFAILPCDDIAKWRLFYGLGNRPFRKVKPPFWMS